MLKNLKVGLLSITLLLSTKSVLGEENQNCSTQPTVCMTSDTKVKGDCNINVMVEDNDNKDEMTETRSLSESEEIEAGKIAKLTAKMKSAAKPGAFGRLSEKYLGKDTFRYKFVTKVVPALATYYSTKYFVSKLVELNTGIINSNKVKNHKNIANALKKIGYITTSQQHYTSDVKDVDGKIIGTAEFNTIPEIRTNGFLGTKFFDITHGFLIGYFFLG